MYIVYQYLDIFNGLARTFFALLFPHSQLKNHCSGKVDSLCFAIRKGWARILTDRIGLMMRISKRIDGNFEGKVETVWLPCAATCCMPEVVL